MAKSIRTETRARFEAAHNSRSCVTPTSPSDSRTLRRLCHQGVIISPAPQVYALPELWQTLNPRQRELYRIRALAHLHPHWVFASFSAAILHGMAVSYRRLGTIHLACTPNSCARDRAGVRRHIIRSDKTTSVDGIATTSLLRTTFDCMRAADFRDALAIADSGLRVSGLSQDALLDYLDHIHGGTRGLQRVKDIAPYTNPLAENGGESIVRAVIIQQGYMIPALQVKVPDPVDPHNEFRVDFYWDLPSGRVAGELDGKEKYYDPAMTGGRSTLEVLTDERLRESRITGSNLKVMRFSYANVMDTRYFCHLLTSYGIPSGFSVPSVALT